MGVDIEEEHMFQEELHGIVDEMKEKLVDEKKILEGTLSPEYGKGEWQLPFIEPAQNELSESETKEDQWKTDSQNGCSTTVHIPIWGDDSNTSYSSASPFHPSSGILDSSEMSGPQLIDSCKETLDGSGCVIAAMNESSDSMEQTTSEALPGTPSDLK